MTVRSGRRRLKSKEKDGEDKGNTKKDRRKIGRKRRTNKDGEERTQVNTQGCVHFLLLGFAVFV